MGSIVRTVRTLRHDEIALLRQASNDQRESHWFGAGTAGLASCNRAVEFDVVLDSVIEIPPVGGVATDQQPFILKILPDVRFAFERCFMQHSVVEGDFPATRLSIAFPLRPDAETDQDVFDWPVSFRWSGEARLVRDAPHASPEHDDVLPIYRYAALREGAEQLAQSP